ncbi:MAG: LysM peptidoglycan-binding domain-containing protein, partial [Bacteroidota bacterium]
QENRRSDNGHRQTEGEIMHTVETKQTLFSISKLYDVHIDQIRKWNGLTSNALDIGQVLVIKKIPQASDLPEIEIPKRTRSNIHIVAPGETFYSLSKRFAISVEELKELNGLVSNELSIGQELIVRAEERKASAVHADTSNVSSDYQISDEDRKSIDKAVEAARKYEESSQPMNFEEIVESGVAEVIEGTDNTRKYLALHRSAEAGTILKVRNDMNNQEVFVRVLGKLPDNLPNENVLIKVSQAAYNRLGAIDPKFRVTISYIP